MDQCWKVLRITCPRSWIVPFVFLSCFSSYFYKSSTFPEAVMNEELTCRNDLYNILKTAHQMKVIKSMVHSEANKLLVDQHGYDEKVVNSFMQVFKRRFLKVIKFAVWHRKTIDIRWIRTGS